MTTFLQARTPRDFGVTFATALAAMAAAGAPVAGWSKRAPQRVIVSDTVSRTVEESEIRADLADMIDLSALAALDPDWCDAWMTWFAEVRIPALPAVWDVPFATATPPQTIAPSDVVIVQATGGAFFELSAVIPVLLSSTGTLRMRARTSGVVGNVAPSSITKINSAPAGLSLTGTPTLFTAGRDIETPQAAIARCLGKWAALGAGWTLDSFDYFIPLFAPTVTRWRVRADNPDGPGTIRVILANAAGPATGPEIAAVLAGFTARNRFCLGCGGFAVAAAALDALTYAVTVKGDGSNPTLAADITAALLALAGPYAIGPALLQADIVRGVALGGAFSSIDSDDGSGNVTKLAVSIPGFRGAVSIGLATNIGLAHAVSAGAVLVLTPVVTIV